MQRKDKSNLKQYVTFPHVNPSSSLTWSIHSIIIISFKYYNIVIFFLTMALISCLVFFCGLWFHLCAYVCASKYKHMNLNVFFSEEKRRQYLWGRRSCWSSESEQLHWCSQAGPSTAGWSWLVHCTQHHPLSRSSLHWRQRSSSRDLPNEQECFFFIIGKKGRSVVASQQINSLNTTYFTAVKNQTWLFRSKIDLTSPGN